MGDNWELLGSPEAIKFIALQRTNLQPRTAQLARRWLGKRVFDRYLLEHFVSPNALLSAYSNELSLEYRSIASKLPPNASKILDIGCGVAGIDVFLFRHYAPKDRPHIFLMDRTQLDRNIYYGHRRVAAFYNDLTISRRFLFANGIPEENVVLVEAARGNIAKESVRFDLIVSLLSWGFHYDLETYLDEALAALADEGAIILDVRKNSESEKQLAQRSGLRTVVIADHPKHTRMRISR